MSIKTAFRANFKEKLGLGNRGNYMKHHARITPVPAFYRQGTLNQHQFKINDVEYEWTRNSYFKKVSIIPPGMVFGEQALISDCTRAATIKAEGNMVEFATLARNEFVGCVRKAEEAFQGKKIAFLRNLLPF